MHTQCHVVQVGHLRSFMFGKVSAGEYARVTATPNEDV